MKVIHSHQAPPRKPDRRPGTARETQVSFVISAVLHGLLLLALAILGGRQGGKDIKLTEIQYIEERYGADVASKVTFAPEKIAPPKDSPPAKREGSLFAEKKAAQATPPGALLGAQMANVPLPKPLARDDAGPFQPKPLQSRQRSAGVNISPKVAAESVLLAADLDHAPQPERLASEGLDLQGKILVGKPAKGLDAPLFEVEEEDGLLAGSALTLALPSGGSEQGHPQLIGGSLVLGKEAYQGDLPVGNLVAGKGRHPKSGLAAIAVARPGDTGDGPVLSAAVVAPTAGTGLISRGGADNVSRGSLTAKAERGGRPATPLSKDLRKEITPSAEAKPSAAPAKAQAIVDAQGVSMTLSGPILDREVLASKAPGYPAEAKQRGWQGTVSVYFTVRPDGTVNKVLIEKASAHQSLDEAARRCLAEWRFSPLEDHAEQWGVLTIIFRLR